MPILSLSKLEDDQIHLLCATGFALCPDAHLHRNVEMLKCVCTHVPLRLYPLNDKVGKRRKKYILTLL